MGRRKRLCHHLENVTLAIERGGEPGWSLRFIGPPPGDYYLIAVDDIEHNATRDPAVLEKLARKATQVTIPERDLIEVPLQRYLLSDVMKWVPGCGTRHSGVHQQVPHCRRPMSAALDLDALNPRSIRPRPQSSRRKLGVASRDDA